MNLEIAKNTHSQFAGRTVDFIFTRPVFASPDFVKHANIPDVSALRILRQLREGDNPILRTIRARSGRKPTIMAFTELLVIAEGKNEL